LIVSTLLSPKTSTTITGTDETLVPTPTFPTTVSIDVSAKFFNPDGCTNLFTGSTNLSQVIGLLTEYERFWK